MEAELTQVGELLRLLEERDQTTDYLTSQILEKIRPSVLDTLCELFGLPNEEIDWLDVQIIEQVLLVVCAINYEESHSTPYLKKLFSSSDMVDNVAPNMKMIRIGLPLAYVFGEKKPIIDFLYSVVDEAIIERIESSVDFANETSDNTQSSFDTSKLTEQQTEQLNLFLNHGRGVKH